MAVLQTLKGRNPGQVFPLDRERSILGRHPDCDIILDVGAVSRQHAQILHVGEDFFVEDLASRNGTYVNGEMVQGRRRLIDKDRVKICDLLFTFHSGSVAEVPTDSFPVDSEHMLVDDERAGPATIMAKVDVSTADTGLRMEVRPEVKMQAIYDIVQALRASLVLDDVLPKMLEALFRIFAQADRGFVVLREEADGPLLIKAVKHRRPGDEEQSRISRTIVNQVLESREAILSADAASDSRFDMSQSIADFRIRSMMCAPLLDSSGAAFGVIQVDTLDQRSRFQEDDLVVLATVALQAAIFVENAQLHEQALKQQATDSELQLAHQVQRGFLPAARPEVKGYDFFDFYEPARHVGGDFFDYIPLPDGRLALVLADVSGKGVPAALLMAKLSAEVRFGLASQPNVAEALTQLSRSFDRSDWEDRFVTMVTLVIDPEKNAITLVNAGHMAPLLRHADGRVEPVGEEIAGVPLGGSSDLRYEQTTITMAPGDALAVFSDGFSEAMNDQRELYGLERLSQQLAHPGNGSAELGKLLLDDVRRFVGHEQQSDDMCLAMAARLA